MSSEKFFRKSDWIACLVTFVVSLTVYVLTLQPTVGLEDSGELIVASDYLGVPHPPGYPIWSLLSWLFQWIFHNVTFHGHPNPAWAVNLFSAVAGAAACGVLALLISRSGMDLLRGMKKESNILGEKTESIFCAAAGISSGLLLAFGQGMWSQAVIAEVYTLNILFQSLVLLFLYRWMVNPKESIWLFLCAFMFGLGITNHQTLMFMGLGMATGILLRDWKLGRDFILTCIPLVVMVVSNTMLSEKGSDWSWMAGWDHIGFWFWTVYAIAIPIIAMFTLPNGKVVGPTFLVISIGLSFYLYMPFSSDQNPPINWGYPRTWQGFMHAITRGQYARVKLAHVFTPRFLQQIGTYLMDLRSQFYGPIAILAAIPFFFCWKVGKKNIAWLVTTLVAFLSVGIVFMILQNPKTDIQNLFIGRVQYIQSHAIYVIWLGYGILFLMAWLETLVKNNPFTKIGGVALVLLLPFALIYKNYTDEGQLKVVGGAEQNSHDFGWQFGNWQLQGVLGIEEDMRYWYPDEKEFEKQWAAYPNKAYPQPMGTNAIFFGGTDPGRFVPTYMIYSAKVRQDVYLITQNALADDTYMNVMRDLYGDQIWIPSSIDNNQAFNLYVQGVRSGKIKAGANLKTEDGKIQVEGVAGVMKINGFLSRMIFDHNQFRTETKTDESTRQTGSAVVYDDPTMDPQTGRAPQRSFYVEESYVLPWMYPYLTPNGLIMKINNKPTPITEEMIKNDTDFWEWYCDRLLSDQKFIRDIVARKSFSKLRCALAGLYAFRERPKEAEAAFRQAIALYDLSQEANFHLANLIAEQGRHDEAIALFAGFIKKDPNNEQSKAILRYFQQMKTTKETRHLLEKKLSSGKIDFTDAIQLISIYVKLNQVQQADSLAIKMISSNTLRSKMLLQLAQQMAKSKRFPIAEEALKKYISVEEKDPKGWFNLAYLQMMTNKRSEMWVSLDKAIELFGDPARNMLREDQRFEHLRKTEKYQKLIPSLQNSGTMGLPLLGL